jgi:hypothetical protein
LAVGIGGAAGRGVATPGDIFAKIFSRRGFGMKTAQPCSLLREAEIRLLIERQSPHAALLRRVLIPFDLKQIFS